MVVWSAYIGAGCSDLVVPQDKHDKQKYVNTLETYLLPYSREKIGNDYLFMKNNGPRHTSIVAKAWLLKLE